MTKNGESPHHRIALSGEYDLSRKEEIADAFAAMGNGAPVTLDMSEVTYIDSTFLNELIAMRLEHVDHAVNLVGVGRNVARVLQIANVEHLFTISTAPPQFG
jgi:anti-anti-sigma factor